MEGGKVSGRSERVERGKGKGGEEVEVEESKGGERKDKEDKDKGDEILDGDKISGVPGCGGKRGGGR